MKKALLFLLICLLIFSARAEAPLTVGGIPVSSGEIAAYMLTVRDAYESIAAYYETVLGVDYWLLTYPNGQTVEEAVKADAFRGLVVLNVLYADALAGGLTLTDAERAVIEEAAQMNLPAAEEAGCSRGELITLYEKQILSEKQYSYLLSYEVIDEAAARDSVDKSRYITYETLCLYVPAGFYTEEETEEYSSMLTRLSAQDRFTDEALPAGAAKAELSLSRRLSSDETLLSAAETLTPGAVSPVIHTEYGLFVLKLVSVDSGDAFYQNAVEDALRLARETAYSEKYNALYSGAEYALDSAFWDEITLR